MLKQTTSTDYLRGCKTIDADRIRYLKVKLMEVKMDEINVRKLWAFLERWTRPNAEEALAQWKKELDEIFM